MGRATWEFPYTADKLATAADVKRTHHTDRLKWWEDKKVEVLKTIKAEGIEIDESLAEGYSNSGNRGATVQVRTDLLNDVNECNTKIREHRAKVAGYDAWVQVLRSQGQSSFNLIQEDWLYFFGT